MFQFDDHPAFRRGFVPGVHLMPDGRLIEFTDHSVAVLRCWPAPSAWRKFSRGGWQAFRPEMRLRDWWMGVYRRRREFTDAHEVVASEASAQLLIPFLDKKTEAARRRQAAYHDFLLQIPDSVRAALLPFNARSWCLLALAARCPGALDLIQSSPALAMALSASWVIRRSAGKRPVQRPLRSARWLVRKPRTLTLNWLGYPGTPSAARILARVPADACTLELLLYLRQALWCPEAAARLGYLPRVNRAVVRVLSDERLRRAVTPEFLDELAQHRPDDRRPRTAYLLMDTLNMWETLRCGAPFVTRSLRHLSEVHDDLRGRMARIALGRENVDFGAPPFTGSQALVPLCTSADLAAEADRMRSCVMSYVERILHGRAWIFRVLAPTRATALIVPAGQGWILREIRAVANRPVPPETFYAVARYFREAQDCLADNPMAESDPDRC